jgi:hypothetical protein
MGLRQTISEWVTVIKEALDFGPGFPDAMETRRVLFAQEAGRLQHLLEQTQKASQEKDQLIARLQAVGAAAGSMVVDGPAYYIRRANALEGPFCTSCFQRNHEIVRITAAPKPKGQDGTPADWVQCARCKTPFRSDRISQFLNPVRVAIGGLAPAGGDQGASGTTMRLGRVPNRDVSRLGARPDPQREILRRGPQALPKPDEPRLRPPASQETGPDDRQQKTEDARQSTELQSPPSSVLLHPPCNSESEPNSPQTPQNPALEESPAIREDALATPTQVSDAIPRAGESEPASAPTTVPPQESDTPKPVKAARKRRKGPKRDPLDLGEAPARETEPTEKAPPAQGVAVESTAPTPDSAPEAPRPARTRSRTRKPKSQRSEKAMGTDRSKPTR